MWPHINILNNMSTILESTGHTMLIYEILDVRIHGLEFAWFQHVLKIQSLLSIKFVMDSIH